MKLTTAKKLKVIKALDKAIQACEKCGGPGGTMGPCPTGGGGGAPKYPSVASAQHAKKVASSIKRLVGPVAMGQTSSTRVDDGGPEGPKHEYRIGLYLGGPGGAAHHQRIFDGLKKKFGEPVEHNGDPKWGDKRDKYSRFDAGEGVKVHLSHFDNYHVPAISVNYRNGDGTD